MSWVGNNMIPMITVPLQPLGLIWHLTSFFHSLLFETASSLGDCALALDCFPSHLCDLSLSSLLLEYRQILTKVLSFSLSLGHLVHNTGSMIRSCHMHNCPLHSPPCLCNDWDWNQALYQDQQRPTRSDCWWPLCLIFYPPDTSSSFLSKQTGICIFAHNKLSPTLRHWHLLFISLGKILGQDQVIFDQSISNLLCLSKKHVILFDFFLSPITILNSVS